MTVKLDRLLEKIDEALEETLVDLAAEGDIEWHSAPSEGQEGVRKALLDAVKVCLEDSLED